MCNSIFLFSCIVFFVLLLRPGALCIVHAPHPIARENEAKKKSERLFSSKTEFCSCSFGTLTLLFFKRFSRSFAISCISRCDLAKFFAYFRCCHFYRTSDVYAHWDSRIFLRSFFLFGFFLAPYQPSQTLHGKMVETLC